MARRAEKLKKFRTDEAAQQIGCSKSTLLRWFREGRVKDVARDRRGWRVFTEKDIRLISRWAEGNEGESR